MAGLALRPTSGGIGGHPHRPRRGRGLAVCRARAGAVGRSGPCGPGRRGSRGSWDQGVTSWDAGPLAERGERERGVEVEWPPATLCAPPLWASVARRSCEIEGAGRQSGPVLPGSPARVVSVDPRPLAVLERAGNLIRLPSWTLRPASRGGIEARGRATESGVVAAPLCPTRTPRPRTTTVARAGSGVQRPSGPILAS